MQWWEGLRNVPLTLHRLPPNLFELTFTSLKPRIGTLDEGVKYIESK